MRGGLIPNQWPRIHNTVYRSGREGPALEERELAERPLGGCHEEMGVAGRHLAHERHMGSEGLEIRSKRGGRESLSKDIDEGRDEWLTLCDGAEQLRSPPVLESVEEQAQRGIRRGERDRPCCRH